MKANRSTVRRIAAGAAISLVAAAPLSAQGATTKTVHIKNIRFSPTVLKVSKGTTVRWTFEDARTPHNVTSKGSTKFKSSHTQQSGSYSVRFNKAGTYHYVCTIHFNMKASIVVH
jgi:plastocyanin